MSRNTEYQFISTDPTQIIQELTEEYESLTGSTVRASSAEMLFITWVASVIVNLRNLINYVGNQNIPSRAEGENLDALGETIYGLSRPQATAASTTMRFYISEEQSNAILIPAGTRVTTEAGEPVYQTVEDVYVAIGDLYADVSAVCMVEGTVCNGFAAGQINKCIDLYTYYEKCENITSSDGGTDTATDDEYFRLMKNSLDSFSTAGARGGYIYHAMQVSKEIQDVVVNSPEPGTVKIYAIVNFAPASSQMKALILAACSSETVRPLTDQVIVDDPDTVTYNIDVTYYQSRESSVSASDLAAAIAKAVSDYQEWQSARIGRDINPSRLVQMMLNAGAKRVVVTSPTYTALEDGKGEIVATPEIASVGTVTVTNGGYEDE